ncbi:hypothetical protein HLI01_22405 [Rhizobium laguerreae]|uniref:hypothetical protein n=1 Tax=Rhizobium laguerreae TaxID=1076926 RepID=UPI00147883C8|nr:hypothetical protein [Rhizobium laguerreae]NNH59490.1 hypothetical protein [Rhizobium laguerreae]
MNRSAAQLKARTETLTIGDLRQMISATRGKARVSKVNPAIPIDRVLGIYEAALEGREDTEIPKAWKQDIYSRHPGAQKPSRDFLIIVNILRDCA